MKGSYYKFVFKRSIKDHAGVIGSVFGLFDTVKERCNSDELNKTLVRLAEGIASAMATEGWSLSSLLAFYWFKAILPHHPPMF